MSLHRPGRGLSRRLAARRLAALALIGLAVPFGAAADAFDNDWCGLDAGEFRLLTDAPEHEARAMVRLLEIFRPVAEQYLPGTPNADNPPLTILVFHGVRDFRRAIDSRAVVGFMQPSFTENLMVVGPDPHAYAEQESLLHEYVHYLLRTRTDINIPGWYDEGLAGMLSSARVDGDGRVVIGDLPATGMQRAIRASDLSLAEVLDAQEVWQWRQARIRGFYDFSRLLVHRLLLGQTAGRADWRPALDALLAGRAPSLPQALDASAGTLEKRLLRYLGRPGSETHAAAAPAVVDGDYGCLDERDKVRRLSLAIVHHNPGEAVSRLREATSSAPDDAALWTALSLAEESADDRAQALAAARRAVALAPDDVSAAVRLADALAMGCILEVSAECRARWQEAVPLLRRSLRRDPARHDAIFTLGLAYLYSGRAGDALNYLRIVHRRQPWAPPINFYLGESYRLIGDSRARSHLERARRWSSTELWRRLAEAGLARLNG